VHGKYGEKLVIKNSIFLPRKLQNALCAWLFFLSKFDQDPDWLSVNELA
jgi:hypothetical protein